MRRAAEWKSEFPIDRYGRIQGPFIHRLVREVYGANLRKYARGRLADVGCGAIPYFDLYRDLVSDTLCVDWSSSAFDRSFFDLEVDLNRPNPSIPSGSFDTILCTDVLEHVHAPHILFSELARLLAPGGHLILGVPFLYWVHDRKHDYFRFTDRMLRTYCETHSLEVVDLTAYGGLPEVLFFLVEEGYPYFNFPLKGTFQRGWRALGRILSRAGFVRRMSERSRPVFPLGYLLVARKPGGGIR